MQVSTLLSLVAMIITCGAVVAKHAFGMSWLRTSVYLAIGCLIGAISNIVAILTIYPPRMLDVLFFGIFLFLTGWNTAIVLHYLDKQKQAVG